MMAVVSCATLVHCCITKVTYKDALPHIQADIFSKTHDSIVTIYAIARCIKQTRGGGGQMKDDGLRQHASNV